MIWKVQKEGTIFTNDTTDLSK